MNIFSKFYRGNLKNKGLKCRVLVLFDNETKKSLIRTVITPNGSLITKVKKEIISDPEKYSKQIHLHWQSVKKTMNGSFTISKMLNYSALFLSLHPLFTVIIEFTTKKPFMIPWVTGQLDIHTLFNVSHLKISICLPLFCVVSQFLLRGILIYVSRKYITKII